MAKNDLRIIKTLRHIDDALLTCIAKLPVSKITVDMLCETAMINRSTFYKHYSDKYALIEDFIERTLREFSRVIKTDFILAEPDTIGDNLYIRIFHDVVAFLYDKRDLYRILWKADVGRNVYQDMTDIISANILKKLPAAKPGTRDDLYRQLYASLFASNLMTMIRWGFQHENEIHMDDIEHIMRNNMTNGIFFSFKKFKESF